MTVREDRIKLKKNGIELELLITDSGLDISITQDHSVSDGEEDHNEEFTNYISLTNEEISKLKEWFEKERTND